MAILPDMNTGPLIAEIAALVGEPARAAMLSALLDGRALTAAELALLRHTLLPLALTSSRSWSAYAAAAGVL